jgi:hypothetical protein
MRINQKNIVYTIFSRIKIQLSHIGQSFFQVAKFRFLEANKNKILKKSEYTDL